MDRPAPQTNGDRCRRSALTRHRTLDAIAADETSAAACGTARFRLPSSSCAASHATRPGHGSPPASRPPRSVRSRGSASEQAGSPGQRCRYHIDGLRAVLVTYAVAPVPRRSGRSSTVAAPVVQSGPEQERPVIDIRCSMIRDNTLMRCSSRSLIRISPNLQSPMPSRENRHLKSRGDIPTLQKQDISILRQYSLLQSSWNVALSAK